MWLEMEDCMEELCSVPGRVGSHLKASRTFKDWVRIVFWAVGFTNVNYSR